MSAGAPGVDADICVVGGGPAGLVVALLLARAGLTVTVLEKHPDFLRDFRGDTVHPSTLDALTDLGLADRVAQLPGRQVRTLTASFADGVFRIADFSRLRVRHPYLLLLPQWDLLELLAAAAAECPGFTLLRSHEATSLITDGAEGSVVGVRARHGTAAGTGPLESGTETVEVRARLVIAADGRHSAVRGALARAGRGLASREFGQPMDVLWFRLPRLPDDAEGLDAHVGTGRLLLLIDRGDYWQAAYVIPKGGRDATVAAGIDALRATVTGLVPWLADRVGAIGGWDDVAHLEVRVDRLRRWHSPGVLLIGDAAHAMSPVGGVGINLAIQDAIAAARMLAPALLAGAGTAELEKICARIQRRRMIPTVGTQLLQRGAARGFVGRVLAADQPVRAPLPVRVLDRVSPLRAVPAYFVGVGLRPERPSAQPVATRLPGPVNH